MDIDAMERWNSLSSIEMGILRAIKRRIDDGEEKIPIRAVAADAYTSTTSVMRLAKKLGYPGFSAMLYEMRADRTRSGGATDAGAARVFATDDSFQQVCALIGALSSGAYARVNIVGTGYSGYVAGYFCQRLQELGVFATEKSPLDFRDDDPVLMVFVSESGETTDLLFIQERCQKKGIEDIVLSANAGSTLCQRARHRIVVERRHGYGIEGADYFVVNCLIIVEGIVQRLWKLKEGERES